MVRRAWMVLVACSLAACGVSETGGITVTVLPAPTSARQVASPTAAPATGAPAATAQAATPAPAPTAAPTLVLAAPASPEQTRELALVALINQIRASNDLPPYTYDTGLSDAARAHSCELAARNAIDHVSADGRTVRDRMPPHDPPWAWPSESIAAGTDAPEAVVAMWMDEPPEGWHRRNILDTEQTAIGVGYCYAEEDSTGNHHYWVSEVARHDP